MKISPRAGYAFAGALLTNSLPHLVIGITGRRNQTPFGRDSSASLNLLWCAMNFVGGCLVIGWMDRRGGKRNAPDAWLDGLLIGEWGWATFGIVYELSQHRRARLIAE